MRRLRAGAAEQDRAVQMRRLFPLALLIGAVDGADAASASVTVTTNPQRPALRVDARGYAEVSWASNGVRRTLLVPPTGRALPGGRINGRDVSRSTRAVAIPFRRVLRRTPDGRYWALQAWRLTRGGPLELRFSRWRGEPTRLELTATPSGGTEILEGRATFQGRPVTGSWRTLEGARIRHAAVLECFACGGRSSGWTWFNSVRTRAGGLFAATVPPAARGARYRATIVGPNVGRTLAPDASAVVVSAVAGG
jgi:hypothetical protein